MVSDCKPLIVTGNSLEEHARLRQQAKFNGLENQFIKLMIGKTFDTKLGVGDQIDGPYGPAIVVKLVDDPKPFVGIDGDVFIPDIYILVEDAFSRIESYKIKLCESFRCTLVKKSTPRSAPL